MRVLVYFRGRILDSRGTPLRARNIVAGLAAHDSVRVGLLSSDPAGTVAERFPEVWHAEIPHLPAAPEALASAARDFQPDVVYGQTHKALPDVAVTSTPGAVRVIDLHGDLPAWRLEQSHRPRSWRLYWYLRGRADELRFVRRVDGFTVVSQPLQARYRWTGRPIKLLWGGAHVPPASVPRAPNGRLHVVYAGNYNPYHGIDTIIEAGHRLVSAGEPVRFTLVGNIAAYPEVEQKARSLLGDAVSMTGLVPYERVPALLDEADVLVIPRARSRTAETTYPSKLSEYLATGKPVVGMDVGEVGRVIHHMKNGLVIPPAAPDALADALRLLRDPALRASLGRRGREFAEQNLSWQRVCEDLVSFFDRVATANRT